MACWDLDKLSNLLQSMQSDLVMLKSGDVGSASTFAIQKQFTATIAELLAETSNPTQSVKDIGRAVGDLALLKRNT